MFLYFCTEYVTLSDELYIEKALIEMFSEISQKYKYERNTGQ